MKPFPTPRELALLLPRYRLADPPISQTEMSVVYRGEDTGLHDRKVAVKILAPHQAGFRARFVREVRVVATLQHPNIIGIYDATEKDNTDQPLYLVMPYIDGSDLRTLLAAEGPLDLARTIRIIEQVAAALDFAHRHGVAHRDVKPGNILLAAETEHVYLCDFGIAKETTEPSASTRQLGTPGYIAPERLGPIDKQATLEPPSSNIQSELLVDVYALGAVLHQCLTGRPPFDFSDTGDVTRAQLFGEPPRVSALRPGTPRAVDDVVRKAMARQPNERFTSCRDLVDALRDASGKRQSAIARPLRPKRLVVGAALVVVAAVVAFLLVPQDESEPASIPAPAGPAPFPTAEEKSLIDLTGLPDCRRAQEQLRNVTAAIECASASPSASSISYYRFADAAALTQAYENQATTVKAPRGVHCSDGTAPGFTGNARLDLRSVEVGSLLCYHGERDAPVMQWTFEPLLVMGRMTGSDPKALAELWRVSFGYGPPTNDLVQAVNRQAAFPNAAEEALLARIPEKSRVDCMRPPRSQIDSNIRQLPHAAAIVCGPTRGASIIFTYQFHDTQSMNGAFARNSDISGPDCTTGPPDFHGDAPYNRNGSTGRLACAKNNNGPSLTWTENKLLILTLAFGGNDQLLDWWRFDAGPS